MKSPIFTLSLYQLVLLFSSLGFTENFFCVFLKKNQSVFLSLSFINGVLSELVLLVHRFSQA